MGLSQFGDCGLFRAAAAHAGVEFGASSILGARKHQRKNDVKHEEANGGFVPGRTALHADHPLEARHADRREVPRLLGHSEGDGVASS